MPNWAHNEMKITGPYLNKVKAFLEDDNNVFSLNNIVPMPKCLDMGPVPTENIIIANVKEWLRRNNIKPKKEIAELLADANDDYIREDMLELGGKFYEAMTKTGYWSWYEWRCDHWGTKWDACYTERIENDDNLFYSFETAWAMPFQAILTLSKRFPKINIETITTVEFGSTYKIVIHNGKYEEEVLFDDEEFGDDEEKGL